MTAFADDEPHPEARHPNAALALLLVLNLLTWGFLGYALLYAILVARNPYESYRYAAAAPMPAAPMVTLHQTVDDRSRMERLLQQGHDPDQIDDMGRSPLWYAAQGHHAESVALLLERGADADLPMAGGERPLLSALEVPGDEGVVLLIVQGLLDYGAEPNAPNTSMQSAPLHLAVQNRYPRVVQLLLNYGADPNALDAARDTPLHLAARASNAGLAAPLLEAGADPDRLNNRGESPRRMCASDPGLKALVDSPAP